MTVKLRYTALALSALVIATAGATSDAIAAKRTKAANAMQIREQCFKLAGERYPSWNQDVKRAREHTYMNCAHEHGVHP